MSSVWGVGNFIAISALAIRVFIAYKAAPHGYRHISEKVAELRILIDKIAHHFKSNPLSSDDHYNGYKVLKSCQNVLEGLNSLIEKFERLVSINERLVFTGVKVGKEDIVVLRERLISNTISLHGLVRRFVVPGILVHQYNLIDINISILVMNMLRPKHSWLLFLVFTT